MAVGEHVGAWFDVAKKWWSDFSIKNWSERVGGSSAEAIEAGIYFLLSFTAGFVFKRYSNYILFSLLVTIIALLGLEYAKFITIDWAALKKVVGMSADGDAKSFFDTSAEWFKNHLLVTVASTIGFLIGYKLG